MSEFLSYEEAQNELGISQDELNDLVARGELRAFHEGDQVNFKAEDIQGLKKSRETEPTIVLSDTTAESLSIGTDEIPIDLDSISTDETVLNIEGLLEDETEGTTPIPGTQLADIGEDTVLDTEGLDLDDDFDLSDDDTLLADDAEPLFAGGGSGRQMTMVKKKPHTAFTIGLFLTLLTLLMPAAILIGMMSTPDGTYPTWISENLGFLNSAIEGFVDMFGPKA